MKAFLFFFLQQCICKDPEFAQAATTPKPTTPKPVCYASNWAGDKACDPQNNTEGCNWDGGDCCNSSNSKSTTTAAVGWKNYCGTVSYIFQNNKFFFPKFMKSYLFLFRIARAKTPNTRTKPD